MYITVVYSSDLNGHISIWCGFNHVTKPQICFDVWLGTTLQYNNSIIVYTCMYIYLVTFLTCAVYWLILAWLLTPIVLKFECVFRSFLSCRKNSGNSLRMSHRRMNLEPVTKSCKFIQHNVVMYMYPGSCPDLAYPNCRSYRLHAPKHLWEKLTLLIHSLCIMGIPLRYVLNC